VNVKVDQIAVIGTLRFRVLEIGHFTAKLGFIAFQKELILSNFPGHVLTKSLQNGNILDAFE